MQESSSLLPTPVLWRISRVIKSRQAFWKGKLSFFFSYQVSHLLTLKEQGPHTWDELTILLLSLHQSMQRTLFPWPLRVLLVFMTNCPRASTRSATWCTRRTGYSQFCHQWPDSEPHAGKGMTLVFLWFSWVFFFFLIYYYAFIMLSLLNSGESRGNTVIPSSCLIPPIFQSISTCVLRDQQRGHLIHRDDMPSTTHNSPAEGLQLWGGQNKQQRETIVPI